MVDDIVSIERLREISEKGVYKTKPSLQEIVAEVNALLVRAALIGSTSYTIYFFEDRHDELQKALAWAGYNVQQESGNLTISWA